MNGSRYLKYSVLLAFLYLTIVLHSIFRYFAIICLVRIFKLGAMIIFYILICVKEIIHHRLNLSVILIVWVKRSPVAFYLFLDKDKKKNEEIRIHDGCLQLWSGYTFFIQKCYQNLSHVRKMKNTEDELIVHILFFLVAPNGIIGMLSFLLIC